MKAQKYTKETIGLIGVTDRGFDDFAVGDRIVVDQKVREGDKERIQSFEGDVLAIHKNAASSTFTIRRIGAHGVAVERIFPFQSPMIAAIRLVTKGDVRRARIYYVRDRVGRAARIKEKRQVGAGKAEKPVTIQQEVQTEQSAN